MRKTKRRDLQSLTEKRILAGLTENIEKAVQQKVVDILHGRKWSPRVREKMQSSIRNMMQFIVDVTSHGPLTLLLDDGGTITPMLGGTADELENRYPRQDETIRLSAKEITESYLLEFPFWVPVRIVA